MDPEIWGPHAWIFLHTITLNYPNNPTIQDKQNYKNFFINLHHILPCEWCAKNYLIHLQKYPIDNYLNTKKNLTQWLINIHNEINKLFNKKTINYSEFINIYKKLYNKNKNLYTFTFYNIIIFILIIIIIILTILSIYLYNPRFLSCFHFQFQCQ